MIKRLEKIYKDDKAYSVRGAALTVARAGQGARRGGSPRKSLFPLLRRTTSSGALPFAPWARWAMIPLPRRCSNGRPRENHPRCAASRSGRLGRVDLKNHDITARLISYLNESSFDIRFASIFALGRRGDPTAIEPLEALLKTGQLSIGVPHAVEDLIAQLKAKAAPKKDPPRFPQPNKRATDSPVAARKQQIKPSSTAWTSSNIRSRI